MIWSKVAGCLRYRQLTKYQYMEITIKKNILLSNRDHKKFLADAFYQAGEEKLPLLIFAHGYKGYKDWGAWDLMAEQFAAAGFFIVKFNFSHNGTTLEKPGEFADLEAFGENNFSRELLDYEAVLDYFLKSTCVDKNRVALMGHSRGGGIAVIKAFEDERVKALVTLAGVSNFRYRFPYQQRLEEWKKNGVMFSENKRTGQQMPHYYQFYEDFQENEERFNIQFAAQHLEKPFLIIQGAADDAVKDKEAFLLHEWCKTSELLLVENANHTFGAKEPWTENTLPTDLETAVRAASDFLKNVV